jgi:uncharacterized repeat protein (TIGR01451 family)
MRNLFTLIALLALIATAKAQTVTFTLTTPACNANGVVTANFSGLTTPINVTWNIYGQAAVVHTGVMTTSDVLTGYTGANISVVAVGANNMTAFNTFSAPPFTYVVSTTPGSCPTLGTALASVSGGVSPYTYQWYDINTLNILSTTNPASLADGTYGVKITDANGCVFGSQYHNDSIYIYSNPVFNLNMSSTAANCTNGTATVTGITGPGTPPYSYLWTNSATTSSISGLSAGSYGVTVTDAIGCTSTSYVYIQQSISISANIVSTPATCLQTNGALSSFGSGGMPPYTYQWSNIATTQNINGLSAGSYTVTVTDANGCFGTGYGFVNASTPVSATYTATASSCTTATGSATLSVTGGLAPYTITWNTFPVQTGLTASNLSPGTYSFHIVDANGCVRNGTVVIPPVNTITASFSSLSPLCTQSNGSITVTASGGTAPYTYSWSNSATSQTISNLPAGGYSVTVTDNMGCSITKYKSLPAYSPLGVGLSTTQASCIYSNNGSVVATPFSGTPPYTYTWSNGGNTSTISNLLTGFYYVHVSDANGCVKNAQAFVPYNQTNNSCYCTITGTVYNDLNNNCTKDAGEPGIQNIQVHCSGYGYVYTNASGVYSFKVPSGSYTLSESVLSYYPLQSCQSNAQVVNVTASSGCTQTVNFANSVSPIHDMHVSTWKTNCPVPGFNFQMKTVISNQGTVTEPNIMAGKTTDNQIPLPTMIPSSIFTYGGSNWYKINSGSLNLAPGASQAVIMNHLMPTNIPLNTSLVFKDSVAYTGPMSNWTTDYSPWNNVKYYTPTVVGSYDPNFKEVTPTGYGTNGTITHKDSVLEYVVHFQNIGTYKAQNVLVKDTLDSDLNWKTLRPIYQSHPATISIDENGVATWNFANINLPAEISNPQGSNGMFIYTVKTKPGLAIGTQIQNKAAIYFDFNLPIITNTTLNTIGYPQSVPGVETNTNMLLSVYPNPADKMFYARINGSGINDKASLKVIDMSGKLVLSKGLNMNNSTQLVSVDASLLSPGIYFVHLSSGSVSQTCKLVIMK